MDARTLINLKDYPIDRDGPERDAQITSIQQQLDDDGCAVLKGFLTPLAIEMMTAEAEAVAHHAHRSFNRTNAYFTKDDPSLPEDDPRRRFFHRSNAFIAADHFKNQGHCGQFTTSLLLTLLSKPAFSKRRSIAMLTHWPMSLSMPLMKAKASLGISTRIILPLLWPSRWRMKAGCLNMLRISGKPVVAMFRVKILMMCGMS